MTFNTEEQELDAAQRDVRYLERLCQLVLGSALIAARSDKQENAAFRPRAPTVAEVKALPEALWLAEDAIGILHIAAANTDGGVVTLMIGMGRHDGLSVSAVKRSRPCTRDGAELTWPRV